MAPVPAGVYLLRHGHTVSATMVDQLAEVYLDARSEPLYDGPLWTRGAFLDRTTDQVTNPGFSLRTAHAGDQMIGLAFGLPFAADRWWAGDGTQPPPDILAATKFAVIELDVRRAWQGKGIGRYLLDDLLSTRTEQLAMLLSMPAAPARQMYRRWGWRQVAQTQPPSGPPLHVLVLDLHP